MLMHSFCLCQPTICVVISELIYCRHEFKSTDIDSGQYYNAIGANVPSTNLILRNTPKTHITEKVDSSNTLHLHVAAF